MDINPEGTTSYTTPYQEPFRKYVENEYWAKHGRAPVNKNESLSRDGFIPSKTRIGFCPSLLNPYDLLINDDEYLTPNDVAVTTPGQSDHTACWMTTARLCLDSLPQAPKNWGQMNQYLNDYNPDPMELSSTLRILDIIDCCRQQEETHSKYADLFNDARDIVSVVPHLVRVEGCFCLGKVVIGWRQLTTTGEDLRGKVVVMQFARGNSGIMAGADRLLNTANAENDLEMKKEAEETKLHIMAKVHDILEMWQGSQNLRGTQKESRAQKKQITAVGYISDMEEIV